MVATTPKFLSERPQHGGNLLWAADLAGCLPEEILDFSASINPLGPPHSAIAAIQSHLDTLCHYPDPHYTDLRQALGQWHSLPPEYILPGNGAAELLTWIGRELSALDCISLFTPTFGDYGRSLRAFGASMEFIPLLHPETHEINPDITAFETRKRRSGAFYHPSAQSNSTASFTPIKRGIVFNNPHNPTGYLFPCDTLRPYLDGLDWVVVDEAFMDFLPPEQQQSMIPWVMEYPNLIVLRSLTKFYSLPGLRLGYAIAHPDTLKRWQYWRDPWPVNTLAVAAALAVIGDEAFQHQTWDWLSTARPHLLAQLSQHPHLTPFSGSANFLLVRAQTSCSALQKQLLVTERVLIRDCLSFPELGDRYFRIAVRTESDNTRLLQGLARILVDN